MAHGREDRQFLHQEIHGLKGLMCIELDFGQVESPGIVVVTLESSFVPRKVLSNTHKHEYLLPQFKSAEC
jgi:hypothetical protein